MTIHTLLFLFGALLILLGILGGGLETRELKISRIPVTLRIFSTFFGVVFIGLAIWLATYTGTEPDIRYNKNGTMSKQEWNTDRLGADYAGFPLPLDDPTQCEDSCRSDEGCKAWTYVKPNTIRGPKAMCYLKNAIPPPQANDSCISGTKDNTPQDNSVTFIMKLKDQLSDLTNKLL